MRIPSCASSVLATTRIYRETYSEREFCVLHEIATSATFVSQ